MNNETAVLLIDKVNLTLNADLSESGHKMYISTMPTKIKSQYAQEHSNKYEAYLNPTS